MKRVAVGSSSREPPAEKKIQRREAVSEMPQDQGQWETVMELSAPFLRTRSLHKLAHVNKVCWKIARKVYWRRLKEPFVREDCQPAALAQLPHTLEPVVYYLNPFDCKVPEWVKEERGPQVHKVGNHQFEQTKRCTVWKCTASGHSGACCRSLRIPKQLLLGTRYTSDNTLSDTKMVHWSLVNGIIVVVIHTKLAGGHDNVEGLEAWFDHFGETARVEPAQLWVVVYNIRHSHPTETAEPSVVQALGAPVLSAFSWDDAILYHGHTVRSANGVVLAVLTHLWNATAVELCFTIYNVRNDSILQRNQFFVRRDGRYDESDCGLSVSLSVGGEMLSAIVGFSHKKTEWNVYDTRPDGMALLTMEFENEFISGAFTMDHEFIYEGYYRPNIGTFPPFAKSLIALVKNDAPVREDEDDNRT